MSFFIYYAGVTLGTENSKFKEVEGVLVPTSFSQKFEMPMGAFFAVQREGSKDQPAATRRRLRDPKINP